MRSFWDPDRSYLTYTFVRQPQTFPDVVLRKTDNGEDILMGIELKGWYLLARKGVPTYRFTVTEEACNPQDLLAVVPWVLSNILAGSPVLHRPFVETARYCAQKRNHYWQHERLASSDVGIEVPPNVTPYPLKSDHISDKPTSDKGGNFGRLARYGLMDDYIEMMRTTMIRGISVDAWLTFFTLHAS